MSVAAQELMALLENEFPGSRYEKKPTPAAPQPKFQRAPAPMYAALPPKRVELPALGGCVEILYDWESE